MILQAAVQVVADWCKPRASGDDPLTMDDSVTKIK